MQPKTLTQPLTVPAASQPDTWHLELRTFLFNRKPRLALKSIETASQHIRVFEKWYCETFNEPFQPQALTNYDLQLYRKHSLEIQMVKAATWNSRHWALALLCNWIGSPELMEDIEQKAAGRASTKHRSLTDNEYHRLIHALETAPRRSLTDFERRNALRTYAAAILMLHGLRVEEVTLLDPPDITINERSGQVRVRNGKGSKERHVPLNLLGRKALSAWVSELRGNTATNDLFEGRTTRSLQRDVSDLGTQIGVPDLTPHWLRYTFAKRLERSGQSLETIRDLLGHSSIEQTKRYLRSSAEELQSAVEGVM
jgi:integrase